jgi:holo-[acyl-carrier protein] synthase
VAESPAPAILGIGLDLVSVSRIARALARWGERFATRVFTPGELAYCRAKPRPEISLAARFAAKEAFLKALGTGLSGGITLRDVEVTTDPAGAPKISLHGRALVISRTSGICEIHVSLTHTGDHAAATVVAVGTSRKGEP